MNDSHQLIGANTAAAILGIPVKNGKPSGTVYDTLKPLECISVQLDGRAQKTWRRGDVEALQQKLAETVRPVAKTPVGRASNFGQWQHRVKNLEQDTEALATVLAEVSQRSKDTLDAVNEIRMMVDSLLGMWASK